MGYILKIYPIDPEYAPDQAQEEAVTDSLNKILDNAGDIDRNLYEKPVYADAGDFIRSVVCPGCDTPLNISPEGEYAMWWHDCMEKQMIEGIDTEVNFPCCNCSIPFRNLRTDPRTGVARFIVEIALSEDPRQLTADDLSKVGDAMGSPCHQVTALYAD